jgi:hypothetical protein
MFFFFFFIWTLIVDFFLYEQDPEKSNVHPLLRKDVLKICSRVRVQHQIAADIPAVCLHVIIHKSFAWIPRERERERGRILVVH